MSEDPFAPLGGERPAHTARNDVEPEWLVIVPVPENVPPPHARHPNPRLGKPSQTWPYRDASGRLLGFVYRFDPKGKKKEHRPLVLFRPAAGGSPEWRWESWPSPRPLYGLEKLAARPGAPVIVCEGEKAADAAQRLLPEYVCITSPNGSKSAAKADWTSLAGRQIVLWPDADAAGASYAETVAGLLFGAGAASVSVASAPAGVKEGWDAADAEAERWTPGRVAEFVANAKREARPATPTAKRAKKEKRRPQRNSLMALCDGITLWHGASGEGFASVPVDDHRENYPINSQVFYRWLAARAYDELGAPPGVQALQDTLRVLGARAVAKGPLQAPWRRVGARAGRSYIDIGDASWRAISISGSGFEVVRGDDLPFLRAPRMRPLCEPEAGYSIDELRPFVNVVSEDDFILVVAWLVAAMRERGPYPILILNGEQGSGKTSLCRLLRSLVDPAAPATQGPPKDERDLVVAAQNAHVLALDNLSHLSAEMSDWLCRLASGAGFATRMLHTDRDENVFDGARPIILNGIPALAERPDLSERSLVVHLVSIPEDRRRPEDELEADWKVAGPRALGALCDAFSSALRRLKDTKLKRPGRMADFEKLICAAEPGLGWEPGTFSAAYEANRRNASRAAFEANPVAVAIDEFIREESATLWSGTATRLLGCLATRASEATKRSKQWPSTAQGLGNHIERVKPLLRQRGVIVERKHSGERLITIVLMTDGTKGEAHERQHGVEEVG